MRTFFQYTLFISYLIIFMTSEKRPVTIFTIHSTFYLPQILLANQNCHGIRWSLYPIWSSSCLHLCYNQSVVMNLLFVNSPFSFINTPKLLIPNSRMFKWTEVEKNWLNHMHRRCKIFNRMIIIYLLSKLNTNIISITN